MESRNFPNLNFDFVAYLWSTYEAHMELGFLPNYSVVSPKITTINFPRLFLSEYSFDRCNFRLYGYLLEKIFPMRIIMLAIFSLLPSLEFLAIKSLDLLSFMTFDLNIKSQGCFRQEWKSWKFATQMGSTIAVPCLGNHAQGMWVPRQLLLQFFSFYQFLSLRPINMKFLPKVKQWLRNYHFM